MATATFSGGYWADFPVTYRAEEIAAIMNWLKAGESGIVIGGSGIGKSNLLGFLGSRPEAIHPHASPAEMERYLFLRLDVNSLPALTVPFFYRALIQILQNASNRMETEIGTQLRQLTTAANGEAINWNDSFQVMTILQQAHRLVIQNCGKKVIWLLDRFDEACRKLDAQALSSLRSLRDQFKGQLCYVVATRHPPARLRNLREIDEFYEIIAANTCRVGPMGERDSRWVAGIYETGLHCSGPRGNKTGGIAINLGRKTTGPFGNSA